jgi:ABC-type transport system substrate-binding protein
MKKSGLILAVFFVLSGIMACKGKEDSGPSPSLSNVVETMSGTAVATGVKKGNVTMGPDSDRKTYVAIASKSFETLDPFYGAGAVAVRMGYALFEKLWDIEYGGSKEVGILAKNWSVSDDGYKIDAELYDNITDWQGNKITADDVVWSYNYYLTLKTLRYFKSIEKTGALSVRITLSDPYYPGFLITAVNVSIVSQKAYEANPASWRDNPVGTGPYKAIKFISGAQAVFQQTYNYWGDFSRLPAHCQAHVDVVSFDVITENSQIQTALATNSIQLGEISTSVAEDFAKDGSAKIFQFPQAYPPVFILNMYPGSVFADNAALREAVAYALDMDSICQAETRGTGKNNGTYGFDGLAGYSAAWEHKYWEYDVEKAKAKLKEAGYTPGQLKLRILTNEGINGLTVAQANLADIGVGLEINLQDETQFLTTRTQCNLLTWDMCLYGTVPRGFMMNIFNALNDIRSYNWGTLGGSKDQALFELTQKALYDQSRENIDAIFKATVEQLNYIPMYQAFDFVGANKKIEAPVRGNSQETAPQASLFADDYDVYYQAR